MGVHVQGDSEWIRLRAEDARQTSVGLCAESRELARWSAACRDARRIDHDGLGDQDDPERPREIAGAPA